ncbi:MAG TPA: SLBB domain-containing protein [Fimbriimonas sp.]|nr:SLBB domain-containing protein [Fimbriimonas sp.]
MKNLFTRVAVGFASGVRIREMIRVTPKIRTLLAVSACLGVFATSLPASAQDTAKAPVKKAKSEEYVFSHLDVITVVVLNHLELSGDFLVPVGGIIVFPGAGEIDVEGLTGSKLTAILREKYKSFLNNPQVSAFLKTPRIRQASVTGEVLKPGPYPLQLGWRLSDIISFAGGIPAGTRAEDYTITLVRQNGERTTYSLEKVLSGDQTQNVAIGEGDVVSLDSGGYSVYVVGQVQKPGLVRLGKGSGVLEAIAAAGGVTVTAATSKVKLAHLSGGEESLNLTPALVNGEKIETPPTRQGDMIVVPESTNQIAVLGYVKAPGAFMYPEGRELRLTDALALAHGQAERASMSRVGISRIENGKTQFYVYNVAKFQKGADLSMNPVIKPGDLIYVPETNSIDVRTILSGISSFGLLWRAGR